MGAVRAALLRFLVGAFLLFPALLDLRAIWGLPRRGIGEARIRLMSELRRISVLQPETHKDLVDVSAAEEHMTSADAFVLEAEGFVQAVRSRVRAEDRQFGFLEATNSHPLQNPLHQHAS